MMRACNMGGKKTVSRWPAFFPEGVPPEDSVPATGIAYRLVRTIPPRGEDFCSTLEERRDHNFTGEHLVNACGTSFHTNLQASRRTRKRYRGLRDRKIATGELTTRMGRQKPTYTPGHLTVWLFVDAQPHLAFVTDAETP